ncbi:Tyrosine recombinase XerC [uncultured Clostridium sp.]|uniref:tyrosine-type recombinase/integrase n=1 Tax=uncultured Clostridium sp. TaxID=59620 RepID=UPI000820FDB6|nr:tyrosine-type recombinase/integrase [uncultured Clostridium sp.]SCK01440.1 Tyrosine recombinase XerC [uncultured Clostridium sp.]
MGKKKANGEGSIYKDENNNRWRGSLSVGRDPKGKLIRKQFYGKTKKEVLDKMNDYKYKQANDLLPTDNTITLEQYLRYWLFEVKINEIKPSTLERYEGILRNYVTGTAIANIKLKDLRASHLQSYYNNLSITSSVNVIHNLNKFIKSGLSQALNENYISKNYASLVTLKKKDQKKEVEYLTIEEQNRFLSVCKGHRLEALFYMALFTGLRLGELLALTWSDIDLATAKVAVNKNVKLVGIPDKEGNKEYKVIVQEPKTKSSIRTVPIPAIALDVLKQHRKLQLHERVKAGDVYENNDIVFANPIGGYTNESNLRKIYKKLLVKAEIEEVKFHSLRHTYATTLFIKDVSPKVVQALMGHSDIATTMNIYTHVNEVVKVEAVQKLNEVFNF